MVSLALGQVDAGQVALRDSILHVRLRMKLLLPVVFGAARDRHDLRGDRIDPIGGNRVVRERLTGERIAHGAGEDAATLVAVGTATGAQHALRDRAWPS